MACLRGKLRRKVKVFCLVSSLLGFMYVSLKLLTAHESDTIAITSRRLESRVARGARGDLDGEEGDMMPPPLHQQLAAAFGRGNKTDLNKDIVPYKVSSRIRHRPVYGIVPYKAC